MREIVFDEEGNPVADREVPEGPSLTINVQCQHDPRALAWAAVGVVFALGFLLAGLR